MGLNFFSRISLYYENLKPFIQMTRKKHKSLLQFEMLKYFRQKKHFNFYFYVNTKLKIYAIF